MLDIFTEEKILAAIQELTAEYTALLRRLIRLEGGE